MLDIEKINSFCAVVEAGSMSGAARRLFLTQPAVSKHVAALEAELGCALFERNGRRLTLTEGGKLAYAFGVRFQRDARQLRNELYTLSLRVGHCIRFGATNYIGTYLVPPALAAYKQAYPERQVSFSIDFLPGIFQLLALERISFALVPESKLLLSNGRLRLTPVARDEMVLVLPAGHALSEYVQVPPEALAQVPLLLPREHSATRDFALERLADAGIPLGGTVDLGTAQAVCQGVVSGMGVAILSHESVRAQEESGLLCCRTVAGVKLCRTLYLAQREDTALSREDEQFAALFRSLHGEP